MKLEVLTATERKVYNVEEVAKLLDISAGGVYRLIRANQIPHKRLGRRIIIPARQFDRWLDDMDDWQSFDAA